MASTKAMSTIQIGKTDFEGSLVKRVGELAALAVSVSPDSDGIWLSYL